MIPFFLGVFLFLVTTAPETAWANSKVLSLIDEARGFVERGSYKKATARLKRALEVMRLQSCQECLVGQFKGIQKYKLGRTGHYFKMNFEFTNNTPNRVSDCVLHTTVLNKEGKKVGATDVRIHALDSGVSVEIQSSVVRQNPKSVGRIQFAFSAVCPRQALPPSAFDF